ncbi:MULTISPECIES: hypothetical protein [Fusobacterium]
MERTINFKVDEELYREIKIKIAKEDKTLKGYILELIKKDLAESK